MISNDSSLIQAAMELGLGQYTEFLNFYHEHNEEEWRVERPHYDEANDPPRILNWVFTDRLMVTIHCNPYHDEGGPTILTAIFQHAFELEDYEYEENPLELRILIQSFDTDVRVIYTKEN